ncbi:MAG: hypothetical protein HY875_10825 [Chloroflexi bacterium]|nr:hypothetical protein [Chloroflexota bacterium]
MTLNITIVHSDFVAQVSDRRLTYPDRTSVASDEANKAVIVRCRNATVAITFCGVGGFGTPQQSSYKGIDEWLAEAAQDAGVAELDAETLPGFVCSSATDLFGRHQITGIPHAFVLAGWVDHPTQATRKRPRIWVIDNDDGTGSFGSSFRIRPRAARTGSLVATGAISAVTRGSRRVLLSRLKSATSSDGVVQALIAALRGAAATSDGASIGSSCLVVFLTRDGRCVTCSFDANGSQRSFGPHVLWTIGTKSVLAAGPVASGINLGIVLGDGPRQVQLLGGRTTARVSRGPAPAGSIEARLRFGELRHTVPTSEPPKAVLGLVALEEETYL